MSACILALALALSPMTAGTVEPEGTHGPGAGHCSGITWRTPPDTIRVLRAHHRGSSVRKHIEVWSFDRYVAAVMASGAWPNRVWESAKVGAIAIHGYALWEAVRTCRTWRGQRYDVTDGEQYLRADMHPGSHLPVRTLRAVRTVWSVTLEKDGHHFRPGWSGGWVDDGWHLGEDSVREAALQGLGWRAILRRFLSPHLRIIER
jgi:hypothetical protein